MINLILLILKILVIILASILGILLSLVLIVLLVPIRYQLYGEKKDEIRLEGKASWLLHLIYLRFTYESNKFIIRLRIFGKLFYDSQNYNDKKKKIKREKKKKNKKVKAGKRRGKKSRKVNKENEDKVRTSREIKENRIAEEAADNVVGKVNPGYIHEAIDDIKDTIIEKAKEEFIEEPIEKAMDKDKEKTDKDKRDNSIMESIDGTNETEEDSWDFHKDSETYKGLFGKIKSFLQKILKIPKKIIELITKIKNSIKKLYFIITEILEKWHKIKAFLKNEVNKKGIKNTFRSIKKIFNHIRPRKLKIDVEFGTGDPCSTGQLLGGLAVFYGYYGEAAHIVPNFETAILEGTIFCKGRIRLFTLLIICIKLIFNREFRKLIENFNAFKEEL
ncbi:DUF2953 domain-containing protein [Anaerocolumna aminovalerica]|uniref:DUF2953 domain-containing protein n=1 Tax=Anaerocolumna aminovalerica TaxID=1527 RepID=UPI00248A91DA|nr:DUF2953 domain-containing protein [Anaerocolumna aminovalerica]